MSKYLFVLLLQFQLLSSAHQRKWECERQKQFSITSKIYFWQLPFSGMTTVLSCMMLKKRLVASEQQQKFVLYSTTVTGFLRYLPLVWPVRQSKAAVEHNDVILTSLCVVHTPISHVSLVVLEHWNWRRHQDRGCGST